MTLGSSNLTYGGPDFKDRCIPGLTWYLGTWVPRYLDRPGHTLLANIDWVEQKSVQVETRGGAKVEDKTRAKLNAALPGQVALTMHNCIIEMRRTMRIWQRWSPW